jgi:hypothetical protein
MYIVLKSHAEIKDSGTSVINYGPVISFTDSFSQVYRHQGNQQTVEAHGARLLVTYSVDAITDTITGQVVTQAVRGRLNEAAVSVGIFNQGDYIAKQNRITVTFPSEVDLTASSWAAAAQGADWVAFAPPDMAPGERQTVQLTLQFVPDATGPWVTEDANHSVAGPMAPPDSYHIIAGTDGRYVHDFSVLALQVPRTVVVERQLGGPLEIQAQAPAPIPVGGYSICRSPQSLSRAPLPGAVPYLPTVLRNHSD